MVRVQNSFAIVSTLFAIPFEVYFLLVGEIGISIIFLLIQAILIGSIYLNYKGNLALSKYFIIIVYSAALPTLSTFIGFESGFYLYYFLAFGIFMSLFDFSEKTKLFFSLSLCIVSLALTLFLGLKYPTSLLNIEFPIQGVIFQMNFTIGIILLSIMNFQIISRYFSINTELSSSNSDLQKTIKEKEILLAEVHHRVKNNLAVMTSLMNLQIRQSSNKEVKEILSKNTGRLRSMSIIHDNLYNQGDLNKIDFKEFLIKLIEDILNSNKRDDFELKTLFEIERIELALPLAVPVGLIVNEIIVNSFKHGFSNRQKGQLKVEFAKVNNQTSLTISDNGVGFKSGQVKNGLGLSLITDLSEQIDAKLEFNSSENNGTQYSIIF
ncbi:MAG: hypothetical protein GQ574_01520 [Crocinitomix sp.]|nr:hypothetical protein [Crocinitomix sp.]